MPGSEWMTAYIGNNDGDKVELCSAAGTVVSSKCYPAGAAAQSA